MSQYSNFFTAFVDGQGGIHVQDYNGTRQIGMSMEKYREMESVANDALSKADAYHKQLVDAGLISPVLSTEEQLAALAAQVSALTRQLSQLTAQGVRNELSGTGEDVPAAGQSVAATNRAGAADRGAVQPDKKRSQ